ncbi:MAG: hypothetical protein FWF02_05925 [Micrococcales bacterium]|nr:hypothetical protein [Micrococcales bacterium]MCL2667229.1 hypothetical protein [Micrococcales bacterium]
MARSNLPPLDPDDPTVRQRHLLALPPGIAADELEVLAVSRFGRASWDCETLEERPRTGVLPAVSAALGIRKVAPAMPRLRLGRFSALVGPYQMSPASAVALGLPAGSDTAWLADGPKERGGPPFPGTGDREGLARAFPTGLPVREEERIVLFLISAARRLGGAVRVNDSGAVLVPDPESAVDLSLLTTRWPSAQEVLAHVRRAAPRAHLAGDGYAQSWSFDPHTTGAGPADERQGRHQRSTRPLDRVGRAVHDPLARHNDDERRLEALRAESAAYQELMGEPELYGIEIDLGMDGTIEIIPEPLPEPPVVLRSTPWASAGVTALRVLWHPHDDTELYQERPSAAFRVARGRAVSLVNAVAVALWAAFDGELADESDFLIHVDDLRIGPR